MGRRAGQASGHCPSPQVPQSVFQCTDSPSSLPHTSASSIGLIPASREAHTFTGLPSPHWGESWGLCETTSPPLAGQDGRKQQAPASRKPALPLTSSATFSKWLGLVGLIIYQIGMVGTSPWYGPEHSLRSQEADTAPGTQ